MILVPIESAYMRLPVRHCDYIWSYLAPFLRNGDLLVKNCLFFISLSHSLPSLTAFPLEFRAGVNREETRVMGLSSSEGPHDRSLSHFDTVPAYDRGTDRQTDLLVQHAA